MGLSALQALPAQTTAGAAGQAIPLDDTLDSARSAALASALAAVADDGSALFENPAGLGGLRAGELSLHHQIWIGDTSRDTLLVALPVPGLGGFGIAANYMDYGSFQGRDAAGGLLPSFSANRIALDGGWGFQATDQFSLGLALRVSQQNLAGSSYSFVSADGGLLFRADEDFSLGLAFHGLGPSGTRGNLPLALDLGMAYQRELSKDWRVLLAGQGTLEQGGTNRLEAGCEAVYGGRYALRAGYESDFADNQLEGLAGLTLGAGGRWGDLALDYAFLPMGSLGASHRISLSYLFPAGPSTPPRASGRQEGTTAREAVNPGAPSPSGLSAPPSGKAPAGTGPASMAGNPAPSSPALPFGGPTTSSLSVTEASPPGFASTGSGDDLELEFKLPPDALKRGKELEKQGRYIAAIDCYTRAIHSDQENLLAWWGLGNIYYRLGKKDYAVRCFKQVLKIKHGAAKLREWLRRYEGTTRPPSEGPE